MTTFAPAERLPAVERLTPRQREVLRGLANGKLKKEIAGDLGISESTVDNYCTMIYEILDVHNKVEAARVAIMAGIA